MQFYCTAYFRCIIHSYIHSAIVIDAFIFFFKVIVKFITYLFRENENFQLLLGPLHLIVKVFCINFYQCRFKVKIKEK